MNNASENEKMPNGWKYAQLARLSRLRMSAASHSPARTPHEALME
jgi:hypothetical protein